MMIEFRGRILLKVILVGIFLILFAIIAATVWKFSGISRTNVAWPILVYLLFPMYAMGGGIVIWKMNDVFSVLRIDTECLSIFRLVRSRIIPWPSIKCLRYYIIRQSVNGASANEQFLEIIDQDEQKIYVMKSIYPDEAFAMVLEEAKKRGIAITGKS